MKRIIVLFIAAISGLLLAQDGGDKTPVELPEFVITGKEAYELPAAEKIKAPVISSLSEEYLKPVYSPDELQLSIYSNPLEKKISSFDTATFYTNAIKVEAGNLYIPKFEASGSWSLGVVRLNADFAAENRRAFTENSEQYGITPKLSFLYSERNESSFFYDHSFAFNTSYDFLSYQFYAYPIPKIKRKAGTGNFEFSFYNNKTGLLTYGLTINDRILSLIEERFKENVFTINPQVNLMGNTFRLRTKAELTFSHASDSLAFRKNNIFRSASAAIQLLISKTIEATGGLEYAGYDTINTITPTGAIMIQFGKGLGLYASFSGENVYLSNESFIRENLYTSAQLNNPVLFRKKNHLSIRLDYEMAPFLSISGGVGIFTSESHPFYQFDTIDASFRIGTIKSSCKELNIGSVFHPGQYGFFMGNVFIRDYRDANDFRLPYIPFLSADLSYSYPVTKELLIGFTSEYESKRFSDMRENNELKTHINLRTKIDYLLNNQFLLSLKIDNLLNENFYHWEGYQEPGINGSIGVHYKW